MDISNPLKIIVFYKDFNTVIWLDEALNKLTNVVAFNSVNLKQIDYVGNATNANIWLYSRDDNVLEIWNPKSNASFFKIQFDNDVQVNFIVSDYKNAWVFTKNKMFHYNYFGALVNEMNLIDIEFAKPYNDSIIVYKNNEFSFLEEEKLEVIPFKNLPEEVSNFSILQDTLYIFEANEIIKLKIPKK